MDFTMASQIPLPQDDPSPPPIQTYSPPPNRHHEDQAMNDADPDPTATPTGAYNNGYNGYTYHNDNGKQPQRHSPPPTEYPVAQQQQSLSSHSPDAETNVSYPSPSVPYQQQEYEPQQRQYEPQQRQYEPQQRQYKPPQRHYELQQRSYEPQQHNYEQQRRQEHYRQAPHSSRPSPAMSSSEERYPRSRGRSPPMPAPEERYPQSRPSPAYSGSEERYPMYHQPQQESRSTYQEQNMRSAQQQAAEYAARSKNSVVIKVGMVGDAQIGKTSLMVKYVEGSWDEDYIQTLGVNFMEKTISIRNTEITFSIWDLGGQREFVNMLPLVCNDAVAILFMFDLTRKSTLNSVKEWYRQGRGFNKTAIPFLVGTKYDHFVNFPREDQEEISNQAKRFAKAMRASLIFSSTSHSINVQKIFKIVLSKAFDLKCTIPEIENIGEPLLIYQSV